MDTNSSTRFRPRAYIAGKYFLAPTLMLLVVVAVVPFFLVLLVSFTNLTPGKGISNSQWVGFDNYLRLFQDTELYSSLTRTVFFALIAVTTQIIFGTMIGEYLFRSGRWRQRWGALVTLPMVLAPVIVGLIWRLLMQGEFGLLSVCLRRIGLFQEVSITSSPRTALAAVCLVDIWQWTPLVAFAYLAARSAVTPPQIEAARIDGASEFRIWLGIIVPLALPTLAACFILRFLDAAREFDKVYVLTAGGPGNATELVSLYIWRIAFRAWDFGYAAALCVFFYVIIFGLTALLLWSLKNVLPPLLSRT